MLSTAIVIFRETVEVALILGIVLAATRGLAGRMKWIWGGFAGGVAGAGIVALFTETISAAAHGVGQEFFNAMILFAAAIVIGWTVLWMHTHAREMAARFKKIGQEVVEGRTPHYTLALIICLAMLREGSETVLFIYGMMLSGQTASSIIMGSAVGVTAGIGVGVALYYGLLKLSTRHMFRVTTWLLVALVAGLTAQAAGFLSAAGHFGNLSETVWDSSWLLADNSILGKTLHSLIGYTAHPTEIQLMFYAATLLTLITLLNVTGRKTHRAPATVAAMLLLALTTFTPRDALAIGTISSPNVHEGEMELEYKGSVTFDDNDAKDDDQDHELEAYYGFTDRFKGSVELKFEKGPHEDLSVKAFELGAYFQFFEAGEYWMDSGIKLAYAHAIHDSDADAVEAKLLLEKQTADFVHRANIKVEKEVGSHSENGVETGIDWVSRYLYDKSFEPGIEVRSNFGNSDDSPSYSEQKHYVGPAAYGEFGHGWKYQSAVLFGVSNAAADVAARWMIEYEFAI